MFPMPFNRRRVRCRGRRLAGWPIERLEPRRVLSAVPTGGQTLVGEVLSPPEVSTAVAILDEAGPSAGRFVAVWQSYGVDGDGYGILAQAFERDGTPVGSATPMLVNLPLTGDVALGNQFAATVASDGLGNIVIAWQGETRTADGYDVLYRTGSVTDAGLALGGQAVASVATGGDQTAPTAAMDATGGFAIAWQTPGTTTADGLDVAYRRGTLGAGLTGPELRPHAATGGDQVQPSVAMNDDGHLVIAWRGSDSSGGSEEAGAIFVRAFAADGAPLVDRVRVNAAAYNDLGVPDVAINDTGAVVVAWQVEGQEGSGSDVYARRLALDAAAGTLTPLVSAGNAGDVLLNQTTRGPQRAPTVGVDGDGDILATWQTQHQDGYSWAIFSRRYSAAADSFAAEGLVNAGTQLGPQIAPDVAIAADGRTVVVWLGPDVPVGTEEGEGGHQPAVHARFYDDAGGTAAGGETVLAAYTGVEDSPTSAATDAAGATVVVWQSWETVGDGSDFGIYAKLLQVDGRWLDANENGLDDDTMLVNTFTAGSQTKPAVASDASGNFIVVWESARQDGSGSGIFARRYNASMKTWADGTEFQVNTTSVGDQASPAVASDASGGFTVVWQGPDADGTGIYRRRFAASGAPLENDVLVNVVADTDQSAPTIAMNDAGEAVIAWVSDHNAAADPVDGEKSVFARWYAATGVPLGAAERLVNTYVKDAQENPAVDIAADGSFVVAWQSINQEKLTEGVGSSWGVYARRFTVDRVAGSLTSPQPKEIRVNQTTDGPQRFASVGVDDTGRFTVAWQSIRQDGSSWGVLARHFEATGAAAPEVMVNTFTNGPQILPAIAQRGTGDFTVVWSGSGTGRVEGTWAQRYRFVRDDFNRGNFPSLGPDWLVQSGDFDVASDVAVVKSVTGLAQLRAVKPLDVAVEGRITLGGGTATSGGLFARSSGIGSANYYWGGIRQDGDGFLAEIGRQVNGVWTSLVAEPLSVGEGLVRFEVLGDSLKLFVDGQLAVFAYDTLITTAGRIGIQGTFEVVIDDFTYSTLRRAAAQVPFRDFFNLSDGSQLGPFWVERAGNFTTQGNKARGMASVNLATVALAAIQNIAVTTNVNVAAAGSFAGSVARVTSDGARMYWGGLVNRGGTLSAEIWLITGGTTVQTLKSVNLPQSTTLDHVVRFETLAGTQRLTINGTLVAETANTTLAAAGSVGMRASAGALLSRLRVG